MSTVLIGYAYTYDVAPRRFQGRLAVVCQAPAANGFKPGYWVRSGSRLVTLYGLQPYDGRWMPELEGSRVVCRRLCRRDARVPYNLPVYSIRQVQELV